MSDHQHPEGYDHLAGDEKFLGRPFPIESTVVHVAEDAPRVDERFLARPETSKILGPDGEYLPRPVPRKEFMLEFFAYETVGTSDLQSLKELQAKLDSDDDCRRYYEGNGANFEHPGVEGVTGLDVLPHLNGKPFDNLALAWIHSLRPSTIRVSRGEVCCDARTWRVTVYLGAEGNVIERISQEVGVGYACGYNIGLITRAREEGKEPVPFSGAIGNTARLAEIDFG